MLDIILRHHRRKPNTIFGASRYDESTNPPLLPLCYCTANRNTHHHSLGGALLVFIGDPLQRSNIDCSGLIKDSDGNPVPDGA